MLDKLFALLNDKVDIDHAMNLLGSIQDVAELIHEDFLKDGTMKQAVIDAVVEIIQKHEAS